MYNPITKARGKASPPNFVGVHGFSHWKMWTYHLMEIMRSLASSKGASATAPSFWEPLTSRKGFPNSPLNSVWCPKNSKLVCSCPLSSNLAFWSEFFCLRTCLSPDQNCPFPFEPPLPTGMVVPLSHNGTLQNTLQKSNTIHQTHTHKVYGCFCSRANSKGGLITGSTKVETCVMLSRAKGIVIQLCWNLLKQANPYNMQGTRGTRRLFWASKENTWARSMNSFQVRQTCMCTLQLWSLEHILLRAATNRLCQMSGWLVNDSLSQQNQWCNSYLAERSVIHSVKKTQDVIDWTLVF